MARPDRRTSWVDSLGLCQMLKHLWRWTFMTGTAAALVLAMTTTIALAQIKIVGNPAVDIVSSTTETSVFSYTIPGNTIGPNGWMRLTLNADIVNNTGTNRNFRIRLKFGGTTTIDAGYQPVGHSANRRAQTYVFWISNLGATNTQLVQVQGGFPGDTGNGGTSSGANLPNLLYGQYTGLAIDTTSPQTLQVTVQLDTNSPSLEWRQFASVLEFAP